VSLSWNQDSDAHLRDPRFLLACLHTDSLRDKRTEKDVKTTLVTLTKGAAALDDAYKKALQRIDGQLEGDRELARKVLSWITFAKRPLTTVEICCALAVEPEEDEIDPENVLTQEDLISVCAGLVVVDQESDLIRLVHYTTQEYFERTGDVWNPGGQEHIATTCLTYLSFSALKKDCSKTDSWTMRLSTGDAMREPSKQRLPLVPVRCFRGTLSHVSHRFYGSITTSTEGIVQLILFVQPCTTHHSLDSLA
jgi:hypothetical protein